MGITTALTALVYVKYVKYTTKRHAAYFVLSWPHKFNHWRASAASAGRLSPDENETKFAPRSALHMTPVYNAAFA